MKKTWLIILTIVMISCVGKTNSKSGVVSKINADTIENSITSNKSVLSKDSILVENKIKHVFSNMDSLDEFRIYIKGKSIIDGTVIFRITKDNGDILLNEEFPSYLLMGYDFEGNADSKSDREKFMINRIKSFFNEKNFLNPAISPNQTFDEDYSDKEIWDEISADKTRIGFSYILGEEDGRQIAYSKKSNKAVLYFNCC